MDGQVNKTLNYTSTFWRGLHFVHFVMSGVKYSRTAGLVGLRFKTLQTFSQNTPIITALDNVQGSQAPLLCLLCTILTLNIEYDYLFLPITILPSFNKVTYMNKMEILQEAGFVGLH